MVSNPACPGQVCCRQKDYWQFVKDIRWLSPGSAHHLEKVGSGGVALCVQRGGERGQLGCEPHRWDSGASAVGLPWVKWLHGLWRLKQPHVCVQATSQKLGVAWIETISCLFLPGQSPAQLVWLQQASPREQTQAALVCVQG